MAWECDLPRKFEMWVKCKMINEIVKKNMFKIVYFMYHKGRSILD